MDFPGAYYYETGAYLSEESPVTDPGMYSVPDAEPVFDETDPLKLVKQNLGEDSVHEVSDGLIYGDADAVKETIKSLRIRNRCFLVIRAEDQGVIRTDRRRRPVKVLAVDAHLLGSLECSRVMELLG